MAALSFGPGAGAVIRGQDSGNVAVAFASPIAPDLTPAAEQAGMSDATKVAIGAAVYLVIAYTFFHLY